MEKKETKLVEALRKDYKQLYVKEYTTRWREERFIRNIELGIMSLKNSEEYISQELDKAREEGKREAFTKDEWFMLKLAMNDIFNKGNRAYEGISEKIRSYLI